MYLLLAVCLFAASSSSSASASSCPACINEVCHRRTVVLAGFETVGQVDIDRDSNILYFHVKDSNKKFYTCFYNLNKVQLGQMWDLLHFSFARAVDQSTRDIYVSNEDTVFKYSPNDEYTDPIIVFNKTIFQMHYKDKLYYTEFLGSGLKYFENGVHGNVEGLSSYRIDDFVIDKNSDIYFQSEFAIYRRQNGKNETGLFVDEIYSLTTDKLGEVYFIQPFNRGIYKLDYDTDRMQQIGAMNDGTPYKAVFTSDNYIIYTDTDTNIIYYLTPMPGKTCRIDHTRSGRSVVVNNNIIYKHIKAN